MSHKKVTIVTVNYNQPTATEELLASIRQLNTYPALEVMVIDNGSVKDPVAGWKKAYQGYTFIRSDENLGFAGGNNLGIRHCSGEYVFLINNDTVITKHLIEKLVAFLEEHRDYAMVSPKIRYFDEPEMLQYAGFSELNFFTARNNCIGQFENDKGQYDNTGIQTHYSHGAAMMIRKDLLDQVGQMPEIYFLYYEEMDWCEMFKRAGYKIGLCMDALIYHKESLATGKNSKLKDYYMNRNRLLFVRRNGQWYHRIVFFCYFCFVLQLKYVISCIRQGYTDRLFVFTKGLVWNLRNSAQKATSKP